MRTVLILVLLFVTPAYAASPYCALWPKSCQPGTVVPLPPAPVEIIPTPPAADPIPLPPPAPVVKRPVRPVPHVQTGKPSKPKWKSAPKRKTAALPDWCARVPSWASLSMVEATAVSRLGRSMTATERNQAIACIASK